MTHCCQFEDLSWKLVLFCHPLPIRLQLESSLVIIHVNCIHFWCVQSYTLVVCNCQAAPLLVCLPCFLWFSFLTSKIWPAVIDANCLALTRVALLLHFCCTLVNPSTFLLIIVILFRMSSSSPTRSDFEIQSTPKRLFIKSLVHTSSSKSSSRGSFNFNLLCPVSDCSHGALTSFSQQPSWQQAPWSPS